MAKKKKVHGGKRVGSGRPSEFGERENHVLWLPVDLWNKINPENFDVKSKNSFVIQAIQEKLERPVTKIS